MNTTLTTGTHKPLCRDCGDPIGVRKTKRGFTTQCDDCAAETDEPLKHLGFNDGSLNKSTNTAIYRGDSKTVRAKIAKQKNRVG